VNGRSHLSIGEVLSLLQDEFPEVTISKIRFLESQGLVDPERTPSGYRKFYEADIDRLRWVLRQQRDAFLPLKVIKGRLDQQGEDVADEEQYGMVGTIPSEDYDEAALDEDYPPGTISGEELTGSGASISGASVRGRSVSVATVAGASDSGNIVSGGDDSVANDRPDNHRPANHSPANHSPDNHSPDNHSAANHSAPRGGEELAGGVPGQLFDAGPPHLESGEPRDERERLGRGLLEGPHGDEQPAPPVAPAPPAMGPAASSEPVSAAQPLSEARKADEADQPNGPSSSRRRPPAPVRGRAERATRTAGPGPKRDGRDMKGVPDDEEVAMEDLVQEGGVDVETIRDLEHYGLITPRVIGGASYYTRDAAVIIQLAWAFARHGVEARHLRAYKGAADREAGLVQQVIMPLIRQRNPEARQAALQTVEELSQLGGELRAALLRSALADLH
jgi:DNA-binding transcriptional MerR regulator